MVLANYHLVNYHLANYHLASYHLVNYIHSFFSSVRPFNMVSLLVVQMWIWKVSLRSGLISMCYLLMIWVRIFIPLVISLACLLRFFFFNPMCCYRSFRVLGWVPLSLWTQNWRWLPLSSLRLLSPSRVLAWGCSTWRKDYIASWWVRMPHRFRWTLRCLCLPHFSMTDAEHQL